MKIDIKTRWKSRAIPYLDGKRLKDCVSADTDAGVVRVRIIGGVEETHRGKVEVRWICWKPTPDCNSDAEGNPMEWEKCPKCGEANPFEDLK